MKAKHLNVQPSKLPLERPAGGSRPSICPNLRNLRFLTLLAVGFGLALWLRADTKPEEPDPTETQMMAVDGTLETLYPELPKVGLMAKSLRLATEDLQETELTVDELIDLVEAYTNAVHQIEVELDIETQADEGGQQE